jgi:hypothetical protein
MPLYDEKLVNKRYIKKHYCEVFLKKNPLLHTENSSVNMTEIESGSGYKMCISYHEKFKKAEKVCSKLTAILAEQGIVLPELQRFYGRAIVSNYYAC